ncbi:hypothetical protein M8818_000423 [Zalaria obscura]|uniref:Uncharacterized protein n=1 Tax=Zalaria obscura TaxID=2024903 RepID=A0ACC3SPQ1_9PEZI
MVDVYRIDKAQRQCYRDCSRSNPITLAFHVTPAAACRSCMQAVTRRNREPRTAFVSGHLTSQNTRSIDVVVDSRRGEVNLARCGNSPCPITYANLIHLYVTRTPSPQPISCAHSLRS